MRKKIIVLGVTGSIGKGALDVIRRNRDIFEICACSAHIKEKKLLEISREFSIPILALSGIDAESEEITYSGENSILKILRTTEADIVVNGIAGSDGLLPSIISLETGKDLALANKETIVMAGDFVLELSKTSGKKIIPVDSEHSAIFHLMENRNISEVKEIILTASGGPFRLTDISDFPNITLNDALKHPTWKMGRKITIDSATMANKGLEVIEAHKLFNIPGNKIKVLIHPESRVHSLIRTIDASMFAQISEPDMKIPIGNALFYPKLMESSFGDFDLTNKSLTFFRADFKRYPLLKTAYHATEYGKAYPIAYNASNEIAVDYFIDNHIKFIEIAQVVSEVLQSDWSIKPASIDEIIETDRLVRKKAKLYIKKVIGK
jgi:1-deoxy-D-xylulose-5-phosphate reductoisomerase